MIVEKLKVKQGTIICQVCEDVIDTVDSPEGVKTWYGVCKSCSKKRVRHVLNKQGLGGEKMMVENLKVKQGTIICQVCEDVIDTVDSPEGVKTWYGVCKSCSKKRVSHVLNKQELGGEKMMVKKLEVKQGTIICQVCEGVIAVVDSSEGVKTWYGVCKGCRKGNECS
ncbi:GapA-binding peptide SR1P [Ectobacillus funiculus]|uniref:GapA-binding peptide SR1P n=1 Tax=Ectobacillus funiculus TaxID=137993 RepID=UPI003979D02A